MPAFVERVRGFPANLGFGGTRQIGFPGDGWITISRNMNPRAFDCYFGVAPVEKLFVYRVVAKDVNEARVVVGLDQGLAGNLAAQLILRALAWAKF